MDQSFKPILPTRQVEDFRATTISGCPACLVCGWPLLASPPDWNGVFCSLCATLGEVAITVRFVEPERGQRRQAVLRAYQQSNRHTIVVAVSQHRGVIHFEFDLWRTGWNLRAEVRKRLQRMWKAQDMRRLISSAISRSQHLGEIHGSFGITFSRFDVPPERADHWETLLSVLLGCKSALESIS
jgi:hypothetical protein